MKHIFAFQVKYLVAFVLSVLLFGCVSGSSVVTGDRHPEIEPADVFIFTEPPSFDYDVVGTVKASSDNGFTKASRRAKAIEELEWQAAQIGANGVILVDVIELPFRRKWTKAEIAGGTSTIGTFLESSFCFPVTEIEGTAIYFDSDI